MNFNPDTIICGDALEILPKIPAGLVDVIITDPVWWGCKVDMPGRDRAEGIFREAAREFSRIAPRVIIHIGQTTDPRVLAAISSELPFVQACWLQWIPVRYMGPIMYEADIAYVFGHKQLPGDGSRLLGSSCQCISGQKIADDLGNKDRLGGSMHPTPRSIKHVSWLVQRFSRPGQLILDPFCGSGTTCMAAKLAGRHYIGIEIHPPFAGEARERVSRPDLFNNNDINKEGGNEASMPQLLD